MKIYLDTNAWVRPFEQGNSLVNQQCNAMGNILDQNYNIISSKFQMRQLNYLTRTERDIDNKLNYQYAKDLCEVTCPNSITKYTYFKPTMDDLVQRTMLSDNEDAIQISIAWIRGADYFITADNELYHTKKIIIERSLTEIIPPLGYNTKNLKILDPVQFKNILNI